jgi:two-component system sensor histidine kinase MprB
VSLRRRITAASALAVAAVAVTLGVVSYVTTRSHLIGNLQQQLEQRVTPILHEEFGGGGPQGARFRRYLDLDRHCYRGGRPPATKGGLTGPVGDTAGVPPQQLGGAPGEFQRVSATGVVTVLGACSAPSSKLPVTSEVRAVARAGHGSFFMTATIDGDRGEILTIGDPNLHDAIEVALPLTDVDSELHGLLISYGLLVGAGILLAGVLGLAIARSALAPIERFSEQTEQVTSELERPRRLEELGPSELSRLAGSFNRTLDALERSLAAQQHLIADASHELRTPLAALRSNIQIFLEAERLPVAERVGLQEAILAELDELTQIVSDVVELARGSSPIEHTEPIELDRVVADAVARAHRRSPGVSFELTLEPTVVVNVADRVGRAVGNVIDNARKWSPENGVIEVSLKNGLLVVRDHGPGFDQADLAHVFERFYRADAARRMSGSGLGLAIVKQAGEAHGGSVEALNAEGGGAMLRIRFGSVA